jgi:SAM-dependent methyltransferase
MSAPPHDTQRDRWNARHAAAVSGPPIRWIEDHRDALAARPRERALDVACGLGRHALLLADMGFDVDALDISDVAVERIGGEARRRGLPVRARRLDLSTGVVFPRPPYEIIVDTYFLERSLFPAMIDALAPGGVLVFETFVRLDDADLEQPCGPEVSLEPGELHRAFAKLEVVAEREGIVDDGVGRRRAVASIVARKPSA